MIRAINCSVVKADRSKRRSDSVASCLVSNQLLEVSDMPIESACP